MTRPCSALRVGGDYSGVSSYNIALCNEPQHRVTDAAIANAQLGYDIGSWSFILSANNLADRRYNSGSVGSIGYPVAPREFFLTAPSLLMPVTSTLSELVPRIGLGCLAG